MSIKQDSAGQASPARKHRNDVFPGGAVISVGSTCLPTTESALSTAFTIGGSYGGLYGMSAVPVVGLEESEGACNALKAQRGGAAECPEDHGETGMDKRGLEPVAEGGPALKKVLVDAMVKMDQSCPQGGSGVCRVGTEVQPNKCRDEAPFRPGKLRTETGADQSRLYRALGNRFLPPPIRRWQDI